MIQQNQSTMPTRNNKTIDFSGDKFYIGLDVHKKSWTVTIRHLKMELRRFTQKPDVQQLVQYLRREFPGGSYFSAYEAGFCGTSIHTALCRAGIQNIIIHAADLPQTDKHRKNKTDLHDSRAIADFLEADKLKAIHVMPVEQQELRALFRCRETKVRDVTRCTNRLKAMLYYFGVEVPDAFKEKQHVSRNFLAWLRNLEMCTPEGTRTLQYKLGDLERHRQELLELTRELKTAILQRYQDSYTCLMSVPGIGAITAMGLLAETGDLGRFKDPDDFAAYLGLTPSEHGTGDTIYHVGLQPRCNKHLRPLLIEAAWVAIRRCPFFLAYFKKHAHRDSKKAIVKVARKLALTAKAVALTKTKYQGGFVKPAAVAQQPAG
jgi:transposase